ncbi:serine/threonine-protein kinase [Nocardiopsis suaedae]|uniref:Serine/threonine-protein kinase n=1 Tax=Nocardiopsis suaedae TaxID=3018444 RepID=A0ABT4TLA5_9ACTN|nr:serine/threonine-protein kinase [Nocardiopsis suaedae]MDA2805484.1 serine/threonine-protein kinase [Nocardiopsis suaedae]
MPEPRPLSDSDPRRVGRYRITGRLGEGGQGTVYLGEAPDGTRAAVKTLGAASLADPSMRGRFTREAEAARRVASFCTAAVLDADFAADPPYIASEYVEGPSLAEAVRAGGPLTGGDLERLAVNTATALVAVHEAGIVHRDLKPDNVLLAQGGARVIDFGVAQVPLADGGRTATAIGTPAFMAPEQVSGTGVGPAADVFAWGAVTAFAATGRLPFAGSTVPEVLHRVLHGVPDVGGVPERLRPMVVAALSKEPERRPQTEDLLMMLLGRKTAPAAADPQATLAAGAGPTRAFEGPGPQAPGQGGPGRRAGRRAAAAVAGAAVLAALALAAGLLLPGLLRGGQGGAEEPGGTDGAAADQGGAPGEGSPDGEASASQEPSPAPTPSGPSSAPIPAPAFTADFEGDWRGNVGVDLWEMQVDEGERSAVLENSEDDDCYVELTLVRGWEDPAEGYEAEVVDSGQGEECTAPAPRGALITLEADVLTVDFDGPETEGEELPMRRED